MCFAKFIDTDKSESERREQQDESRADKSSEESSWTKQMCNIGLSQQQILPDTAVRRSAAVTDMAIDAGDTQEAGDDTDKQQQQQEQEKLLQKEKMQKEQKERMQNEQLQKEKMQKEKIQKEPLQKEKMLKEQMQKEKMQKEPLQKEKMLKEQMQKEKMQKEQLQKGKMQKEQLQKEKMQKEQLQKEKIQKEQLQKEKMQKEQLQKEKMQKEQLQKEKMQKEQLQKEKMQKEQLQKEKMQKEQLQKEKMQKEQLQKEKMQKEQLQKEKMQKQQLQKEKIQKEQLQKEKMQKEQLQKEKMQKEQLQKEKMQKEQLQKEKIQKEQLQKEKMQKEQLQKEKMQKEKTWKEQMLIQKEKMQKEQLQKEKMQTEKMLREQMQKEQMLKEQMHKEQLQKEQMQKENMHKEKMQKGQMQKDNVLKEKMQKERHNSATDHVDMSDAILSSQLLQDLPHICDAGTTDHHNHVSQQCGQTDHTSQTLVPAPFSSVCDDVVDLNECLVLPEDIEAAMNMSDSFTWSTMKPNVDQGADRVGKSEAAEFSLSESLTMSMLEAAEGMDVPKENTHVDSDLCLSTQSAMNADSAGRRTRALVIRVYEDNVAMKEVTSKVIDEAEADLSCSLTRSSGRKRKQRKHLGIARKRKRTSNTIATDDDSLSDKKADDSVNTDVNISDGVLTPSPPSVQPRRFIGGVVCSPLRGDKVKRRTRRDNGTVRRSLRGRQGDVATATTRQGRVSKELSMSPPKTYVSTSKDVVSLQSAQPCNNYTPSGVTSTETSSLDMKESSPSQQTLPASTGSQSFAIIDVAADRQLFESFIAEWKGQTCYSLSVACDPVQADPTVGIGNKFNGLGTCPFLLPQSLLLPLTPVWSHHKFCSALSMCCCLSRSSAIFSHPLLLIMSAIS